jgi:hypothetical protein
MGPSLRTFTAPPPQAQGLAAVKGVQDAMLTRVGLELPGKAPVGEQFPLELRKIEHRRDRGEWILAHGPETIAGFGSDESAARNAEDFVRTNRAAKCAKIGNLTFLIGHDKKPLRVPFQYQLQSLNPNALQAREISGKWCVADALGKPVLAAPGKEEAEQMAAVMKWFELDTLGRIGGPGKGWIFAGKSR